MKRRRGEHTCDDRRDKEKKKGVLTRKVVGETGGIDGREERFTRRRGQDAKVRIVEYGAWQGAAARLLRTL